MSKPLRFEGSVTIDAPRLAVWDLLCDPAAFQRILPTVTGAVEHVPQQSYEVSVGVPFVAQVVNQTFAVEWHDVIQASEINWDVCTEWGGQLIRATGYLSLEDDTLLRFSAEFPIPPPTFPISLIHQLTSNAIRTYFTGLKREAERQAQADLATA